MAASDAKTILEIANGTGKVLKDGAPVADVTYALDITENRFTVGRHDDFAAHTTLAGTLEGLSEAQAKSLWDGGGEPALVLGDGKTALDLLVVPHKAPSPLPFLAPRGFGG